MPEQPAASAGDLHHAFNPAAPAAPSTPAAPAPEYHRAAGEPPPENPRSRGISPARDRREAVPPVAENQTIKVGDVEYTERDVRSALAERAEREIIKQALPASPSAYELKLPETFEPPVGLRFELDANDPLIETSRRLAHQHGLTQQQFSDFLGVYAAAEVTKAQRVDVMRQANVKQLGSAAGQRIDGLATFLTAHAGKDGQAFADFLRRYPSATMVRALEHIQRALSSQGATLPGSGDRNTETPKPAIPKMSEGASYSQARAAQDQILGAQVRLEGKRR